MQTRRGAFSPGVAQLAALYQRPERGGAAADRQAARRSYLKQKSSVSEDLDIRRRRALYRASHRGTKEMDWVLGRFAETALPAMSEPVLAAFERLLRLPDPDLQDLVMDTAIAPAGEFAELIAAVRTFHGLGGAS
jgi:antitoxin CptB